MSDAAIDIHDAGLSALRSDGGAVCGPTPGFARVDGERIVTGVEAWSRHRLLPREVHHRFWSELSTAPLPRPFPQDLASADLAHAQLDSLWHDIAAGTTRAVLAVPGTWSDDALSLALAVARACGIPVVALVDAAVAAAVGGRVPSGAHVHVDVRLHETVVTGVDVGAEIVRRACESIPGAGSVAIRNAWSRWVAGEFVKQTRFDPLDRADSDQALWDALDEIAGHLRAAPRTTATLDVGDRDRSADLSRDGMTAAAGGEIERIRERVTARCRREGAGVVLSATAAAVPGLAEALAGGPVAVLSDDAVVRGALEVCTRVETVAGERDDVPYLSRIDAPGAAVTGGGIAERRESPTHLALDGCVHRIPPGSTVLGSSPWPGGRLRGRAGVVEGHCAIVRSDDGVFVEPGTGASSLDGRPVRARARVQPGARLTLGEPDRGGGIEAVFLREAPGDG